MRLKFTAVTGEAQSRQHCLSNAQIPLVALEEWTLHVLLGTAEGCAILALMIQQMVQFTLERVPIAAKSVVHSRFRC